MDQTQSVDDGEEPVHTPQSQRDEQEYLEVEQFSLFEVNQRSNGRIRVGGSPVLKTSEDGKEQYFMERGTDGESSAFESLIRQQHEAPRHAYDPDDPLNTPSYDWDTGIADVLQATLNATDAHVDEVVVKYAGKHNGTKKNQARVSIQGGVYNTDTWVGVLAGMLDDAPIKVQDVLWEDRVETENDLAVINEFIDYTFYDVEQATYEPEEAAIDEELKDWEFATYIKGVIYPDTSSSTVVTGVPHNISPAHSEPQMYITGDDEERTIPVSPAPMTSHATAVYKDHTDQNPYVLEEDAVDSPIKLDWPELVSYLLQDADHDVENIIELQNIGSTVPGKVYNPDVEVDAPHATDLIDHYFTIDGDAYRVPAEDVQNFIPSKTTKFKVIDNYSNPDNHGRTFY